MRKPVVKQQTRCAIYTRKSTDDGLEQEYNSLDAQYDACAAYIASHRHEGWHLVTDRYDDGGFSGGNMERPSLRRLLADIGAGKIDTIVIYKVDRLTRSLSDFAKIVEILDKVDSSFVSVTQAFNTTTSMGRLTLNMLLSFAQFEREVTGERIRDKIAASKRKGLWMGGPVPLGYLVQNRKLIVDEAEANLVRHIYARYLQGRSVQELADELNRDGHRTKVQVRTCGPHRGGCIFRRGTLYHLLANRIYLGDIVHKGEPYQGEHPAIIPQELWDAVQRKLADRGPGAIVIRTAERCSHLIGLLFDGHGRPMISTHTKKGRKRYRYYATRQPSAEQPAWRVTAHDIEQIVVDRICALLLNRNRITRSVLAINPRAIDQIVATAAALARNRDFLAHLPDLGVERVDLTEDQLAVTIREDRLLEQLGLPRADAVENRIHLMSKIGRVRRGREFRLVIPPEDHPAPPALDEKVITLLGEAIAARELVLSEASLSINQIASKYQRCRTRLAKLVRISWLAPDIVRGISDGSINGITAAGLLAAKLPIAWLEHRAILNAA